MAGSDIAVTLGYQPASYWRGDYTTAVDANPIVQLAMQIHPVVLIACTTLAIVATSYLILRLRPDWAIDFCVFLVIAHAICVCGWIARQETNWLVPCLIKRSVKRGLNDKRIR